MTWLRKILGLCEHDFENMGIKHITKKGRKYDNIKKKYANFTETRDYMIYFCRKCGKEIVK